MNRDPLRLRAVTALPNQSLHLVFQDGFEADVGLGDWIANTSALQALADPALFSQARVGEWGSAVEWITDELDLGADNLRNLAIEQAGGIGHERIWVWMHDCGLTQQQAADAVGISRRMLNYYLSGSKPIPKTVWLACKGWQAEQREAQRRPSNGRPSAGRAAIGRHLPGSRWRRTPKATSARVKVDVAHFMQPVAVYRDSN